MFNNNDNAMELDSVCENVLSDPTPELHGVEDLVLPEDPPCLPAIYDRLSAELCNKNSGLQDGNVRKVLNPNIYVNPLVGREGRARYPT